MFSHTKNEIENDLEPTEFYLSPNYPNPFREKTVIKYCIARTTMVKLTIFDSEGKEIIKLVDEEKNPGTYEVEFTNKETEHAPSQQKQSFTYLLEAGDYRSEMEMELIK